MHYFLGMEVSRGDEEPFFSQCKYANETLKKFHMDSNNPMETPLERNWKKEDVTLGEVVEADIYRQLVGSLMYLVNTRSKMCFAVNQLSQAIFKPTKLNWKEVKHVMRYLIGTTHFSLRCRWTEGEKLLGFTDAYWVWIPSNGKITSGGIIRIGSAIVSWCNRKKKSVAISLEEAKYMVAS